MDTPVFPPDRPAAGEGRYHLPGDPWPLYASLEPATVWAEWAAATRGAVDPADERRRLWSLEVDGLAVLDLRDAAVRRALEVDLEDLTGTRVRAQALAARVRDLDADGLIVPSAARPEHWNLVVFPSGFGHVRPVRSRVGHPAPPAR